MTLLAADTKASGAQPTGKRKYALPRAVRLDPAATHKRCPDCRETESVDAFPRNRRTSDGRATYCKECHNTRSRETRERLYGGGRHYHLMRRYGLGAEDVQRLVDEQNGVCAICAKEPAVHVDHDHETGEIRGVLCFTCNAGLGNFRDSPLLLDLAITYLEDYVREEQIFITRKDGRHKDAG